MDIDDQIREAQEWRDAGLFRKCDRQSIVVERRTNYADFDGLGCA
jgi:hypothetical protein